MIVSTAMLVLPVWRSPTMSSLCPSPTGTIESMARIPVDSDSETVNLDMMPAEGDSTSHLSEAVSWVFDVTVFPVASKMDPRTCVPTGIERILGDVWTCWPRIKDTRDSKRSAPCVNMPSGSVDILTIVSVPPVPRCVEDGVHV